ncbi:histidinol dehydrogenase [Salinicoccus hispanicus]|uniref:Histidinol dehydrogenase n=1 Tax=Salinicoccus hispanicus TaxID=157225 RepID=A0A6N8U0A3_9STAP|nr:histidinol dehydrogenase [Salinicoccus hispanicus]MXQ51504.1 histidinol dehydrogenase [Salinicoccus hispanicus]
MNVAEFKSVFDVKRGSAGFDDYKGVMEIIEQVRTDGDRALHDYTAQFDNQTVDTFKVDKAALKNSYDAISEEEREALETIKKRIEQYQGSIKYRDMDNGEFQYVYHPIERVGVYVPGGTALYPSSVLMTVVPALAAGVKEIHVVTPTFEENNITFAALHICGVENVYTVGGAQAIAALAYGTETIPKVDKIVGPGNYYVALAKRLLFGEVGIDMIAGPSEILIYVDQDVHIDAIVYDLFAQAEHDVNARTFLISEDEAVIKAIEDRLDQMMEDQPRSHIIRDSIKNNHYAVIDSQEALIGMINDIAPEHVSIQHKDADRIIRNIRYAGAVFNGYYSPEAIGDYVAGPSHVLPTDKTGRFSHGLNVNDFMTSHAVISLEKSTYGEIAGPAKTIARREQLDAHYQSLHIRTE